MPTKEAIKKELDGVNNIYEILDVMKHMASSQYSNAKKESEGVYIGMVETLHKEFADVIESIKLENLSSGGDKDPILYPTGNLTGIITVASDQAFMGGHNSKILKVARLCAEAHGQCTFLVTGRKGAQKMKFNKLPFVPFPAIKDGPMIRTVTNQLTNYAIEQMRQGKMARLFIVAAENVSFTKQLVEPKQLLPFTEVFRYAQDDELAAGEDTYLESELTDMTDFLARQWLGSTLYQMLLSAKAAEFGALATTMEGNLGSVKKVQKKLKVMYKRARNEKVDAGMREIFVSTMVASG